MDPEELIGIMKKKIEITTALSNAEDSEDVFVDASTEQRIATTIERDMYMWRCRRAYRPQTSDYMAEHGKGLTLDRVYERAMVWLDTEMPRTLGEDDAFDEWTANPKCAIPNDPNDVVTRQLTAYCSRLTREIRSVRSKTKADARHWVDGLLQTQHEIKGEVPERLATVWNEFLRHWDCTNDAEQMSPEARALWTYLAMDTMAKAIQSELEEEGRLYDTVPLSTLLDDLDGAVMVAISRVLVGEKAAATLKSTDWLDDQLKDKVGGKLEIAGTEHDAEAPGENGDESAEDDMPLLPKGMQRPTDDDIESFKQATQSEMYETKSGRSECLRNEEADFFAMTAVALHYWKNEPEQWKPFVRQYRFTKKKGTSAHKCWHGLTNLEGIREIWSCFVDAKKTKRSRLDAWKEAVSKDHSIIPSYNTIRWIDIQGKVVLAKAIARGTKFREVEDKLRERGMAATLDRNPKPSDFNDFDETTARWIVDALTRAEGAQDPVPEKDRPKLSKATTHPMIEPAQAANQAGDKSVSKDKGKGKEKSNPQAVAGPSGSQAVKGPSKPAETSTDSTSDGGAGEHVEEIEDAADETKKLADSAEAQIRQDRKEDLADTAKLMLATAKTSASKLRRMLVRLSRKDAGYYIRRANAAIGKTEAHAERAAAAAAAGRQPPETVAPVTEGVVATGTTLKPPFKHPAIGTDTKVTAPAHSGFQPMGAPPPVPIATGAAPLPVPITTGAAPPPAPIATGAAPLPAPIATGAAPPPAPIATGAAPPPAHTAAVFPKGRTAYRPTNAAVAAARSGGSVQASSDVDSRKISTPAREATAVNSTETPNPAITVCPTGTDEKARNSEAWPAQQWQAGGTAVTTIGDSRQPQALPSAPPVATPTTTGPPREDGMFVIPGPQSLQGLQVQKLDGTEFIADLATFKTLPSVLDKLWDFSGFDGYILVHHPGREKDLRQRFTDWAQKFWLIVRSPNDVRDMDKILRDAETSVGHDRDTHKASWGLQFLRGRLGEELYISDLTRAIYGCVMVHLIKLHATIRLGCGRGGAEAVRGLPWHDVLGDDYPQYRSTEWYIDQVRLGRQDFIQHIKNGEFLVATIPRDPKRKREDADIDEAIDDEASMIRGAIKAVCIRRELKRLRRSQQQ
ncbi:hypothetical protein MAPG_05811 [Magnaporthiopsis poae ATCC 64411]|uniref:Uncharacterized protein n=1 Tax=Magnaporthiopsis poae (strain ATCC 64411 / 73-15) TaxID=644358 RepID=A0A0C4E0D8_MAGP6|nr:hypothetical protein MAPG_05811 [Magnaporthiopsis poae ATCC 64411]